MSQKPNEWVGRVVDGSGFTASRPDEFAAVNARRRDIATHVIEDICYADEWIVCTCGAVIKAEEDRVIHDRHQPLVDAWAAHKREARIQRAA